MVNTNAELKSIVIDCCLYLTHFMTQEHEYAQIVNKKFTCANQVEKMLKFEISAVFLLS